MSPEPDDEEGQDQVLRDDAELVAAIEECATQFQENEAGYRERRYHYVAVVYAISLRMLADKEARTRFFELPYWKCKHRRKLKGRRDFFRDVFKFVTNAHEPEENKLASKYGKVLWYLDNDKVSPEDAEGMISASGGIEKIARQGLYKPFIFDPRDVGDGMTATGEKIYYPGDEEEEEDRYEGADDLEVTTDNPASKSDASTEEPEGDGPDSRESPTVHSVELNHDFDWDVPNVCIGLRAVLIGVQDGQPLWRPTGVEVIYSPLPDLPPDTVLLQAVPLVAKRAE